MNFDDFADSNGNEFSGSQLMRMWFPEKNPSEDASLQASELSDEEYEEFRNRLNGCMPGGSMMLDLWDEDIRFEDSLSRDWYFRSAFGTEESLSDCASQLEQFFIAQVARLALDYNQHGEESLFFELIRDEARQFVKNWRKNISSLSRKPLKK